MRKRSAYSSYAGKSKKRSRTSKSMVPKTTPIQRIFPYSAKGTSPLFDPFPAKIQAKLRYTTTKALPVTISGTVSPYIFSANGIFDPDVSGLGHQPYGHDTYQTIYNHYSVESATITMTPTNGNQCIFGITLTDDTTVNASYDTVREVKTTRMGVNNGQPNSSLSITKTYNRDQIYQKGSQKDVTSLFGARPVDQQYFHCWAEGILDNVTVNPTFLFTITYIVDMWELKDLGQS